MQISHPTTLTSDDHAVLERLMCTLSGSRESNSYPVAADTRNGSNRASGSRHRRSSDR